MLLFPLWGSLWCIWWQCSELELPWKMRLPAKWTRHVWGTILHFLLIILLCQSNAHVSKPTSFLCYFCEWAFFNWHHNGNMLAVILAWMTWLVTVADICQLFHVQAVLLCKKLDSSLTSAWLYCELAIKAFFRIVTWNTLFRARPLTKDGLGLLMNDPIFLLHQFAPSQHICWNYTRWSMNVHGVIVHLWF